MTNITRTGIHPPRGREAVMTTTALEFADEDRNNLRNIKKSNDEILTIFQIKLERQRCRSESNTWSCSSNTLVCPFCQKVLKTKIGREKYKEYRELERRLAEKCGENCMVMRSTWLRNTISGSLSSTGIFHCSHQARPSRRRTGETSFRPEALPLPCTILTKNSLKVARTQIKRRLHHIEEVSAVLH